MLRPVVAVIALGLAMICVGATGLHAADWQWPSQMNVAGFSVTDIRGSVSADGSGTASGVVQIPGIGGQRVSLTRSSRGEVTGTSSINARVSGADVQGNFALNSRGLTGRGTVRTLTRPISDASMSINSRGQITGSGRVSLGRSAVGVDFQISSGAFNVTGSVRTQPPSVDTPLAVYKFDGNLNLRGNSGRIDVTAAGSVQRTGKLANQVTNYSVSNIAVNSTDGRGTVNVGGVSVTFAFF